jgi:hypothetical protein
MIASKSRHSSPSAILKQAARAAELLATENEKPFRTGQPTARQRVCQTLQIDTSTLSRWLSLLTCPPEILDAYKDGKLSLTLACKVGQCGRGSRDQIVNSIRRGIDPATAINAEIDAPRKRRSKANVPFRRLLRHLSADLESINVEKIRGTRYLDALPALRQAHAAIGQMITQLSNAVADDAAIKQAFASAFRRN